MTGTRLTRRGREAEVQGASMATVLLQQTLAGSPVSPVGPVILFAFCNLALPPLDLLQLKVYSLIGRTHSLAHSKQTEYALPGFYPIRRYI